MHDYRGYLEGACPPDPDWLAGPDLDAGALLESYFQALNDETLRGFDPSFSDSALMAWDRNFAPDGALYLYGARGAAVDCATYRRAILNHLSTRGLLGPRRP